MSARDGHRPARVIGPNLLFRVPNASVARLALVFFALLLVPTGHSSAQSADDSPGARFSIGGLAGRTSGLSLRVVLTEESMRSGPFEERAVDVNASFNFDGHLHVTAHVTAERPVENSPLTFHIGPGWLAGTENGETFFGASGNIGVYFTMERYQIVMQLMPSMTVTPDLNGQIGAAVGMRVSF